MYAVIETGGKQYRVSEGDKIRVEKLAHEVGDEISLERVLLVSKDDKLQLANTGKLKPVSAKVCAHGRLDKISIIKMRRRKNSRRQAGHRQHYTELEITKIS